MAGEVPVAQQQHPRQVLILAGTAIVAWLVWTALRPLAGPFALARVVPVAAAGMVVTVGSRDGLPRDRPDLVRSMIARRRTPRLPQGAQWVEVQPGPEFDPVARTCCGRTSEACSAPPWPDLLHGQTHLAFEYVWDGNQVRVGVLGARPDPARPGRSRRPRRLAWVPDPHHGYPRPGRRRGG